VHTTHSSENTEIANRVIRLTHNQHKNAASVCSHSKKDSKNTKGLPKIHSPLVPQKRKVIPNETGPNLRGFGHETLSGMFIKQGLATG
jgi:hypothetical protein